MPDLFTRVHHENNHYLNTLAAWILGPGRGATWYRMPSIIAGAGTILTAGLIARRSGRIAGVAAVLLTAASYPLVHYSSEARGYAMAVFFGLVFWNVQTRYQETRERGWLLLAWLAGVLGILAQPLLICLVAASLATGLFNAASKSGALASVAAVHAVPLVFFAWIYAVDLRHAQRPGGPIEPLWMVVLQTLSLAVGGPHSSGGWWGAGLCAFCLHLASLLWLRRQPEHNAGFCLLAAWLMPLAVVLIEGRAEVYPRYFLPGIAILLINLGQAAEHAWQKGRWGKRLCLASLALFVAANGVHIGRLLRDGRGRFDQVVEALSNAAGEGVLTVGGDHDFRIETMLNYHASGLAANRRIRYFRKGRWPTEGPTWLLTHSFAVGHNPEPVVEAGTLRYALKRQFEYAGLSGWATFLYLRQNAR